MPKETSMEELKNRVDQLIEIEEEVIGFFTLILLQGSGAPRDQMFAFP